MASEGSFWGIEVKPGKPERLESPEGAFQIHLSQASLAEDVKHGQKARVSLAADGKKFVICSLKEGVCENAALDLILDEDLTFQVKGDATVHLTGYYLPASDDEDLASGSESEGEEFSSDEDGVALLHPDDIDSDDLTSEGESDLEEAHGRLDVEIKELDEEDVVVTTAKALPAPEAKPAPAGAKRKAPDSKAEPEPETKKGTAAQKATPAQKAAAKKAEAATPAQKPVAKTAQAATPKPAEAAKPAAAAAKTPKTRTFPNGFEITTVKQGLPDAKVAKAGKTVVVKYTGRLKTNGKVFDSTKGNKTFNFKLGVGEVIKGWDRGVDGMRVGEKRRLIIPPQMGYGGTGAGKVIPPNAWLDFEVELVNVRG